MTDISRIVTGIQGRKIDAAAPSDGYTLIWDESDSKWKPKPNGLNREYFTSSGTWICPEGITSVLIIACGGASGGFAGRAASNIWTNSSTFPGISAVQVTDIVSVTPGETYSIVIGEGGLGGIGEHITTSNSPMISTILVEWVEPTSGGSTSFSKSETVLFSVRGSTPFDTLPDSFMNTYNNGTQGSDAEFAPLGDAGRGGYGSLFGPQGNGVNGGDGAISSGGTPTVASNGSNAENNTGVAGAGGGNCGYDSFPSDCTSGNGGNGGSGYMYIIY